MVKILCAACALLFLSLSCDLSLEPGALVPPTADQDSRIQSIPLTVAGHTRLVHVRTYGSSDNPTILFLHGSLSDFRGLLPLIPLADDGYHLVFWDQRGNGLSERITGEEYTEASIIEEITAVADTFAPGEEVILIGHSFGAMYTSLYLSAHPERVAKAVMMEPGGLNGKIFSDTFSDIISINLFDPKMNSLFWNSEQLAPMDHETADYRAHAILYNGSQTRYHPDPEHPAYWPVWRPGGWAEVYRGKLMGGNAVGQRFSFDFARGAGAYPHPVLFIGGSASALGAEYQRRHHAPLFSNGAAVVEIPGAGHRLVVEDTQAVLQAIRGYITQ